MLQFMLSNDMRTLPTALEITLTGILAWSSNPQGSSNLCTQPNLSSLSLLRFYSLVSSLRTFKIRKITDGESNV